MPTAKTSKKTPSTRKKTTKRATTRKKTSKKMTTEEEKKALIGDLKKSIKDIGRIPGIIFAPVIAYVSTKYDKIPEDRRKKLKGIVDSIKKGGKGSLQALKDWFASAKDAVSQEETKGKKKKTTAKKKKPATKKASTKKKTTRASSKK